MTNFRHPITPPSIASVRHSPPANDTPWPRTWTRADTELLVFCCADTPGMEQLLVPLNAIVAKREIGDRCPALAAAGFLEVLYVVFPSRWCRALATQRDIDCALGWDPHMDHSFPIAEEFWGEPFQPTPKAIARYRDEETLAPVAPPVVLDRRSAANVVQRELLREAIAEQEAEAAPPTAAEPPTVDKAETPEQIERSCRWMFLALTGKPHRRLGLTPEAMLAYRDELKRAKTVDEAHAAYAKAKAATKAAKAAAEAATPEQMAAGKDILRQIKFGKIWGVL